MASLEGYIVFSSDMYLRTGLRVGSGGDKTEIGGIENPIIKNPVNGEPYVPGSSIKGKLRSIMEWQFDKVGGNGRPCECSKIDCPVCRIFGIGSYKTNVDMGPPRLIVRDAIFNEDSREKYIDILDETGEPPIEKKFENTIDRRKGSARMPRIMERIPAGFSMDFEVTYRVMNIQDDVNIDLQMYPELLRVIKFLESDTLGGSGSRGYGRVEFRNVSLDFNFRDLSAHQQGIDNIKQAAANFFPMAEAQSVS
ncbi:MAG: type III-A CRISPR-associated RAMP protein Csm3 [bacterium]